MPTQTYTRGQRSTFIQKAQEFLNQTENCQVATTSHGSPGQETDYLGPATERALQCFQAEQGLPVTGTLTPETYALLAGVTQSASGTQNQGTQSQSTQSQSTQSQGQTQDQSGGQESGQTGQSGQEQSEGDFASGVGQQSQQNQQQIVYPGTEITQTHQNGSASPEVKQAQVLLNRTACGIGPAGSHGSAGNETEYFGSKTETAIKCYQGLRGMLVDGILTPALYAILVEEVGAAPAITVQQGTSGSGSTQTTATPPAGTQSGGQQQGQSGTQQGQSQSGTQSQSGSQQSEQIGQIGQQGQGQQTQQQGQRKVNEDTNDNSGYVPVESIPVYRSRTPPNRGAPPAL